MILCMNPPINPAPPARPVTAFNPPVHLPPERRSLGRRMVRAFGAVLMPALLLAVSISCYQFLNQKQGSGTVVTQERVIAETVEGVELYGSPTVNVVIDPEATQTTVQVTTDDNLLMDVKTEVKNQVLRIIPEGNLSPSNGIRVEVRVKSLSGATLTGSGDINVAGINGEKFTGSITGSGDIRLHGSASAADLSVMGSGDLHAEQLDAASATATVTGSGDITLKARESASLSITGSGDITVAGQPSSIKRSITGSGDVHVK